MCLVAVLLGLAACDEGASSEDIDLGAGLLAPNELPGGNWVVFGESAALDEPRSSRTGRALPETGRCKDFSESTSPVAEDGQYIYLARPENDGAFLMHGVSRYGSAADARAAAAELRTIASECDRVLLDVSGRTIDTEIVKCRFTDEEWSSYCLLASREGIRFIQTALAVGDLVTTLTMSESSAGSQLSTEDFEQILSSARDKLSALRD